MITIVLATAFVAGCTENVTNTTSPSPTASTAKTTSKASSTPKATATPAAPSTPTASEFTAMWQRNNLNETVVTPFTKSVNERGHVTFTGVTRSHNPFTGDVDSTDTFELCKDKADAQQTYQQLVNQASLRGYLIDSRDENSTAGHIQTNKALANTILISWNFPFVFDYGIGYYVETNKFLAPND